ncbi:hypothetical protein BS297_30380 [Rhodococcus erythropolis]|uniref:Uncharacterized protein n=1 Tax=Rhodococcus erythropolis TaxID=1833 RepID=A0A5N5DVS1_RHOER|nr:hypothetical protein BS297_30380 [Rhodococcus erythropolis]
MTMVKTHTQTRRNDLKTFGLQAVAMGRGGCLATGVTPGRVGAFTRKLVESLEGVCLFDLHQGDPAPIEI